MASLCEQPRTVRECVFDGIVIEQLVKQSIQARLEKSGTGTKLKLSQR
jgi:hypothetical protein